MKKTLLLISSFLSILSANSQNVFSENWDGIGPGISGWTLHNVDARTPNTAVSFVNAAWVRDDEEFDNNVAMSTSWYTPAGASNDWLVSPSISIPAGTTILYWDARAYDATFRDSYRVYVSTAGSAVANLTNLMFTQGNGTTGSTGENVTWTRRSVDLSAYAGQTINIGFQNFSNDMFLLSVDNINVVNNATCTSPNRTFTSSVTTNSVNLNWTAVAGASGYDLALGTPGFTPSTATHTSATNSFTFNGLNPNTRYQVYVRNSCGSIWVGPYSVFTANILPYTYGFETPAASGSYFSDGWTGAFSLNNTAGPAFYADGVQMVFSNSSTTAVTNRWLFSRPIFLTAGEAVTLKFSTRSTSTTVNNTLIARVGSDATVAAQTTTLSTVTVVGTNFVETTATYTAPSNGTYYFSFNHSNPATTANTSLVLDRVILTSVLSNKEFLDSKFLVYPNPTKGLIDISNDTDASILSVELSDINGRVVKSFSLGENESQINISEFSQGIYLMKIISDKGIVTKKIIKE
jgi:hypothetical protein